MLGCVTHQSRVVRAFALQTHLEQSVDGSEMRKEKSRRNSRRCGTMLLSRKACARSQIAYGVWQEESGIEGVDQDQCRRTHFGR